MALSVVASNTGSGNTGDGDSFTIAMPGGESPGDLILVWMTKRGGARPECSSPGFEDAVTAVETSSASNDISTALMFKYYESGDPASLTISCPSGTGSNPTIAAVLVLNGTDVGFDALDSIDVHFNDTTPEPAGITTNNNDAIVFQMSGAVAGTGPSDASTDQAGATEFCEVLDVGSETSMFIHYEVQATAGAYPGCIHTYTGIGSSAEAHTLTISVAENEGRKPVRVSQTRAEVLASVLEGNRPPARVSQLRAEILTAEQPAQPTIFIDDIGHTTLDLSSSAYDGPVGSVHTASRWQVADATDGAFSAPYFDSGEDAVNLTSVTATGLPVETDVITRVQHLSDAGLWSPWSLTKSATTGALPGKPVVTIVSSGSDFIELSVSPFVAASSGSPQKSITYQITDVSDVLFSSPIVDYTTEFDAEFEGKTFFGLNLFLNQYIIRVLVTDEDDVNSQWSDTAGPTGLQVTGQYYTPFGERELGFQLRMADWDEVVEAGGESTWTNLTDPDAICLVVSRREIVTGSPGGIDPIRWKGFPEVDKQIVWTRVKFDEVGEGPNPCPSADDGTSSPNGIICRIEEGLVEFDKFDDPALTGWRVVRSGAGTWAHHLNQGVNDHESQVKSTGAHALGYQSVLEDKPDALIMWDAAGIVPAGHWIQIRYKIETQIGRTSTGPWGGVAIGAQNDEEQYHFQSRHECGIFNTWDYSDWWKRLVTGELNLLPTFRTKDTIVGDVFGLFASRNVFGYVKASIVPSDEDGYYSEELDYEIEGYPAFPTREGFRSQHRVALDSDWKDGGVGIVVHNCGDDLFDGYEQGQALLLFDFAAITKGNTIVVKGLPEDWYIRIRHSTLDNASQFDTYPPGTPRPLKGDAAGNDKEDDFDGHAYPADVMLLYDNEGNLVEEWEVGDNALGEPGIWGGDVYRINVGGVGVGPIGGISLRTREIAIPDAARLTEDDDTRITEAGDIRITE